MYTDRQKICPKYVESYSKNKFAKSVHLIGFIIRICHVECELRDCRSSPVTQAPFPQLLQGHLAREFQQDGRARASECGSSTS